jgi:hypothetical protein
MTRAKAAEAAEQQKMPQGPQAAERCSALD